MTPRLLRCSPFRGTRSYFDRICARTIHTRHFASFPLLLFLCFTLPFSKTRQSQRLRGTKATYRYEVPQDLKQ
ncbi:hypothetical protein CTAM01_07230 [Colletotrichum tamarilloi]|uniref:Uncharacterized protein n=1 Tax=Colletotrichum tamarilloi TaxID=1209934 RepID=A0ABQ9R9U9_9PEZI|nr:uncharacterized protein CTAM01_07230 [Colletotrichum tamarilloi]KAI3545808.1 hypothetical protein CSPX01_04732 [Colletotrichum filicis]KAK1498501.1 hypothetical protein CTAM01_07230 [Colletotrichum tamarilloi]